MHQNRFLRNQESSLEVDPLNNKAFSLQKGEERPPELHGFMTRLQAKKMREFNNQTMQENPPNETDKKIEIIRREPPKATGWKLELEELKKFDFSKLVFTKKNELHKRRQVNTKFLELCQHTGADPLELIKNYQLKITPKDMNVNNIIDQTQILVSSQVDQKETGRNAKNREILSSKIDKMMAIWSEKGTEQVKSLIQPKVWGNVKKLNNQSEISSLAYSKKLGLEELKSFDFSKLIFTKKNELHKNRKVNNEFLQLCHRAGVNFQEMIREYQETTNENKNKINVTLENQNSPTRRKEEVRKKSEEDTYSESHELKKSSSRENKNRSDSTKEQRGSFKNEVPKVLIQKSDFDELKDFDFSKLVFTKKNELHKQRKINNRFLELCQKTGSDPNKQIRDYQEKPKLNQTLKNVNNEKPIQNLIDSQVIPSRTEMNEKAETSLPKDNEFRMNLRSGKNKKEVSVENTSKNLNNKEEKRAPLAKDDNNKDLKVNSDSEKLKNFDFSKLVFTKKNELHKQRKINITFLELCRDLGTDPLQLIKEYQEKIKQSQHKSNHIEKQIQSTRQQLNSKRIKRESNERVTSMASEDFNPFQSNFDNGNGRVDLNINRKKKEIAMKIEKAKKKLAEFDISQLIRLKNGNLDKRYKVNKLYIELEAQCHENYYV